MRPGPLALAALLGAVLHGPCPAGGAQPPRAVGDEAWQVMRQSLEVDRADPLAPRSSPVGAADAGRVERVVFTGARAARVPAQLETPIHTTPPWPCVLLVHGLSRSKEHWWTFGSTTEGKLKDRLVAAGFAVLALDLPLHGERLVDNDYQDPRTLLEEGRTARFRELFADGVVDHRRALDYLATRADVDTARVGLLGYELGGAFAFCLAAVEPRLRAAIACATPAVDDGLALHAPQSHAPRIRRPFLMLMADNSRTSTRDQAEALFGLVGAAAKELKVYHSDDRLPIWYVGDAVDWLSGYLKP